MEACGSKLEHRVPGRMQWKGRPKSTGDKAKNLLLYPKGTGEPQKFTKDGEEHGQVCVSGGPLWGRRAVRAELLAQ